MPPLRNGSQLTPEQRAQVLSVYINRDTLDSPWNATARALYGKGPATQTDAEWIDTRVWVINEDGRVRLADEN